MKKVDPRKGLEGKRNIFPPYEVILTREEMKRAYSNWNELEKFQLCLGDYQLLYLKRESKEREEIANILYETHRRTKFLPTVGVEIEYPYEIPKETIELLNQSHDLEDSDIPKSYSSQEKSEIRTLPTNPYSFRYLLEEIMQNLPKTNPSVQICVGMEDKKRLLPIFLALYFMHHSCILPTTNGDDNTLGFPGAYIGQSVSPHLEPIETKFKTIDASDLFNRKNIRLINVSKRKGNKGIGGISLIPNITQTNYFIMYTSNEEEISDIAFYAAKLHSLPVKKFKRFEKEIFLFLGLNEKRYKKIPIKDYGIANKMPEEIRDEVLKKAKTHLKLDSLVEKVEEHIFMRSPLNLSEEERNTLRKLNNSIKNLIEINSTDYQNDMLYLNPSVSFFKT